MYSNINFDQLAQNAATLPPTITIPPPALPQTPLQALLVPVIWTLVNYLRLAPVYADLLDVYDCLFKDNLRSHAKLLRE